MMGSGMSGMMLLMTIGWLAVIGVVAAAIWWLLKRRRRDQSGGIREQRRDLAA